MGLLNLFTKSAPPLLRLPFGSFTVDRAGKVLTGFNVTSTAQAGNTAANVYITYP